MNTIYNAVATACMTYLFVNAEPIAIIRQRLGITPESDNSTVRFFGRMLECCLCSGFWMGLALTMDPVQAAIGAVAAEVLSRRMDR